MKNKYEYQYQAADAADISSKTAQKYLKSSKAKVIHKPLNDPYFVSGSEEEIMAAFIKTRDDIIAFIETMPKTWENQLKQARKLIFQIFPVFS